MQKNYSILYFFIVLMALTGFGQVVPCNVSLSYSVGGTPPAPTTINMYSGSVSTCSGTFYDPGGTGNYANSTSLITMTLCSDQPGEQIILDFTAGTFQVETNYDFLQIYNGVGTGGTQLWNSQSMGGSTNPGIIQSTSGCLTITFSSDGSVTYTGWVATISCTNPGSGTLDCNGGDVTLTAVGQGQQNTVMGNNFNSGLGSGWVATGGSSVGSPCGSSLDGTNYYWASTSVGTPNLTTISYNVSCGGTISFDMAYSTQGGASPCEGPDLPDEGVYLQYSTNGGSTWTIIQYWDPLGGYDPTLTSWNTYTIPIPAAAMTPNTQFQWIQTNSSGTCCDNWGIDNVYITANTSCNSYWYNYTTVPGWNNPASYTTNITSTTTIGVWYTNGTSDSCYASTTIVVPPGTTANAGPDQVICGSGSVTIGANPICPDEGATYTWSTGATGTIDLTAPGVNNGQITVSPAVTTTYNLQTSFNGCTATDAVTVIVDAPPTASNPATVNVQCAANIPAPNVNVVTDEADDVTVPPTVTYIGDVSNGLSCPETITRTYRVSDACGNFINVQQLIIIDDTQPPVFSAAPANVTVACIGAVPAMTNLNWTDNCDGAGSVAGVDGPLTGGPCGGTITRTWTYTDACGNPASATQTITVNDNVAPVLAAAPANVTVACIGQVPAMTNLNWTDNCDGAGSVTGVDGPLVGGACGGTITRTWTYTDGCGNTATRTQIITVNDNVAPVMAAAPANVSVQCTGDVPPMVSLNWTDNCDGAGSVTGVDSPLSSPCGGTITRTWTYTDGCGNTATRTQTITVNDTQAPVLAAAPANLTVQCQADIPAMTNLNWTDNCDGSGSVTGVDGPLVGGACGGTITRTWTYTDACGNTATATQVFTIDDTTPPTATAPPNQNLSGGSPPAPNVNLITDEADNCTASPAVTWVSDVSDGLICPETVTRTYRITDNCGNYIDVVQLFTIGDAIFPTASNPATINVECYADVPAPDPLVVTDEADNSATPVVTFEDEVSDGLSCPETLTRRYRVTDDCGNYIFVSQQIVIQDVTAPIFAIPLAAMTVECVGDVPAMTMLGWTDNCDGSGFVNGSDTPIVGGNCGGTITRSWSYTDACGNTASVSQAITISDTQAPVFAAAPANVTVECVGDVPAMTSLSWTDNCDGAGSVSGTDSPIVGGNCGGTITRTWTYTDACGNTATSTQTITINDTQAPVLAVAPANITVQCVGDVPAMISLNWTDNCDGAGSVVGVDSPLSSPCGGTITRTWTYTDACGNVATASQTITVNDNTPPTASNPATTVVPGGPAPAVNPNVVTDEADNCTANPVVAFVSEVSDGNPCPETITRTYSVTDNCGNQILVTHIIQITDPIMPTASNPLPVTVECIGDVPAPDPLVVTDEADNQTTPVVAWVNDVSNGQSCPETITRTYSVTDVCGNQILVQQTITVNDVTNPTGTAPAAINVECIGDVPAPDPLLITNEADNCTANPVVAWVSDASDGLSCPETITRTYSITDDCGNQITVQQLIIVNDVTAPTGTAPATVNVECIGDVPAANPLLITDEADNCTANPVVAWVNDVSDGLSCPETITRTYSITDNCGNQTTVQQLIIVDDVTAPTASNPVTVNVECIGDVPAPDVLVVTDEADNCTANPIVAWVNDVSNGQSCPETITRTYSITDACGNQSTVQQSIIVNDVTNPTAGNPVSVSVECMADVPAPDPLVVTNEADNCTANPVVAWVNDVSNGQSCPQVITRTYSVTDACGNQITVQQTITVNDITYPTGTAPASVNVECIGDVPAPDPLLITDEADNCTPNPVVAWVNDVSDGQSCPETITRTYSITDDCGNQITVQQLIIVNDITNPTASNPVAVNVECIGDVPVPNPLVVTDEADNCTANPVVAWVSDVSDGQSCPETITRTYSVTDDCGNFISVTQTIIVNDVTAPTASNPFAVSVPGSMDVPAPDPLVVTDEADNCTVNPVVAWVSDVSDGNVCNNETITRTYSITDDCGNVTYVTQLITILATYPPIDAGPDQLICAGQSVVLTAGNPWGVPISWSPGNPPVNGVPFYPTQDATYTVTADNLGCISTDQVTVTVEDLPTVNFMGDVLSGCAPLTVTFTNGSYSESGLADCVWQMNGATLNGCNGVTYTFNNGGSYDVTLTTTSNNGCVSSETYYDYVYVEDLPDASFIPSSTSVSNINTEVSFSNTSTGATSYLWDFGDGLGTSSAFEPIHTFPYEEAGSYVVELVAYTPLGCTDTAWMAVNVTEDVIFYIPNTFTPDGDNYNDNFRAVFTSGFDPYDFSLFIFNRWGEIMWESHDASVGWDGTYGGDVVQDGTYIWKIEFKNSTTDEHVLIKGHVNVIR